MHDTATNGVMTMMKCGAICSRTINYCLEMGGEHASKAHINLLMDCVNICEVAANFAIRDSNSYQQVCRLCAEICTRCADACDAFGKDDQNMQHCAQACRQCAEVCHTMA